MNDYLIKVLYFYCSISIVCAKSGLKTDVLNDVNIILSTRIDKVANTCLINTIIEYYPLYKDRQGCQHIFDKLALFYCVIIILAKIKDLFWYFVCCYQKLHNIILFSCLLCRELVYCVVYKTLIYSIFSI